MGCFALAFATDLALGGAFKLVAVLCGCGHGSAAAELTDAVFTGVVSIADVGSLTVTLVAVTALGGAVVLVGVLCGDHCGVGGVLGCGGNGGRPGHFHTAGGQSAGVNGSCIVVCFALSGHAVHNPGDLEGLLGSRSKLSGVGLILVGCIGCGGPAGEGVVKLSVGFLGGSGRRIAGDSAGSYFHGKGLAVACIPGDAVLGGNNRLVFLDGDGFVMSPFALVAIFTGGVFKEGKLCNTGFLCCKGYS